MAEQDNTTEKKGISKGTSGSEKAEKKPLIYVVLWIPTLIRGSIVNHPIQTTITRNLSDIDGNPFCVEMSLQENNDIVISILNEEGNKDLFLKLNYVQESDNGLVEYSFIETHLNDCEDGFRFTSECFPVAVYHMIKELYHEHEFHDQDNNLINTPFISTTRIDLHNCYNSAILHYLREFERSLSDVNRFSRYALRVIRNDQNVLNDYRSFDNLRVRALGTMTYYNTLISTVQDYCDGAATTNQQREIQNLIFNLENAIRYYDPINFEMERRDLRRQMAVARWSLILTIILALAGIAMSVYSYCQSSKDLENTKSELVERMNILDKRLDLFEKESSGSTIGILKKQKTTKQKEQNK